MICNKCGAQNAEGTPFCASCGNRLAAPQNNYQPYQQVPPMQYAQQTEPVTSIGKYLLWWLVGFIPLVGFILTIVFAVDNSNKNRANFFRAQLIIMAIGVLLSIIVASLVLSAGVGMMNEVYDIFDTIEYLV